MFPFLTWQLKVTLSAPGYFNMLLKSQEEFTFENPGGKGHTNHPTKFPDCQEKYHYSPFIEDKTPTGQSQGTALLLTGLEPKAQPDTQFLQVFLDSGKLLSEGAFVINATTNHER